MHYLIWSRHSYFSYFTVEEMEVQRDKATCPRSHTGARTWTQAILPQTCAPHCRHAQHGAAGSLSLLTPLTGSLTYPDAGNASSHHGHAPHPTHKYFQLLITFQKYFWLLEVGCGTSSQEEDRGGSAWYYAEVTWFNSSGEIWIQTAIMWYSGFILILGVIMALWL